MAYDLIIIGAGPAGITASVYAARMKMNLLVISKDIGGQAAWSGDIENYTGYQFISGPELTLKFQKHMDSFGIKLNMPEDVKAIKKDANALKTITDKGEYISKSVIIASGKRPRLLNVEGEKEFKNKGVTYCAICDGPLFKDKRVAVIGGGNSALDAALQLMNIASQVHIINIAPAFTADPVMVEKIKNNPNVKVLNKSIVKRIYGDAFVKGIEVQQDSRVLDLKIEGVFIEIGLIPNSDFAGLVKMNAIGEVVVDALNRTSVAGIFACGDVTNVPEKQIIIACGEGAKATLSVFKYLTSQ